MKVVVKIYNFRTLHTWIDYKCLIGIIQQSIENCSELSFVVMSELEKKMSEGTMDAIGIVDIIRPFFIETVDENGKTEARPDLDDRLIQQGDRLLSNRRRTHNYEAKNKLNK